MPLYPHTVKAPNSPLVEEVEPILETQIFTENATQPYIGLYATNASRWPPTRAPNAREVSVIVSFDGTDTSVIQEDNWLLAGIAAQGQDSEHGGCYAIDWGYTYGLLLNGTESDPFVHAEVHEVHEWHDCLPGYSIVVSSWKASIPDLHVSSYVNLTMKWTDHPVPGQSDYVDYYATVNGQTHHLYRYYAAESANPYFMVGTEERYWGFIPLGNTVKWLQFFGAWSEYNIGTTGWHSYLIDPSYKKVGSSSWTKISFAYSTDGENSYFDNVFRWGGDPYNDVDASYYRNYVHFYPTSDGSTLDPDTLLWSPPTPPPGGGGCPDCHPRSPTLFVWNGSDFGEEFTFHFPGNSDVTLHHVILQDSLVPLGKNYLLRLRELNHSISHIDFVRLYVVTPQGELHEYFLGKAIHSEFGDVEHLLLHDDEDRVDLEQFHDVDLRFKIPKSEDIFFFIFEIQGSTEGS